MLTKDMRDVIMYVCYGHYSDSVQQRDNKLWKWILSKWINIFF